jgi:hypothetical protein
VLTQSSQALQHAWAIKRLTERFSPEELRQLSPEARTNWLAMIRGHCRALQHMNAALRQELRPIFFPAAGSDQSEAGIQITDDRELVRTAERLLGICTSNHKLMSSAFTVSAVGTAGAAIGVPQFFQSLINAELLAARIARVR